MTDIWRFGPVSEADFELLLALRIDVMREHLERVFRYRPERARRIFRDHFDEPGLRLILVGDELGGYPLLPAAWLRVARRRRRRGPLRTGGALDGFAGGAPPAMTNPASA
jgi:hypothetical protein